MGTATTYLTVRLAPACGVPSVLSVREHNLSREPGFAAIVCLMRAGWPFLRIKRKSQCVVCLMRAGWPLAAGPFRWHP